jgi:V/A-type H+-transporting ATPase subunit E
MPYEDLIQSVETSARERMNELVERARNETEEILREVRSREEEIKRKRLDDAQKTIEVERIRLISRIKEENKMKIYGIKDELYHQAFRDAREKLESLRNSQAYEAVYRTLAREAITEIGIPHGVLHIDPRDETLCGRILKESGNTFEIATDLNGSAGLAISSPDGSIIVTNTFESRLRRAEDLMRPEIFSILFGD